MNQLANVEVVQRPGACFFRITGEVDLSNAHDVGDAIDRAVTNQDTTVVVDLSPTTYLDSSGIQLLVHLAERLADRRHRFRVVVPEGSIVRTVLDLTGLGRIIPIRSTVEDVDRD